MGKTMRETRGSRSKQQKKINKLDVFSRDKSSVVENTTAMPPALPRGGGGERLCATAERVKQKKMNIHERESTAATHSPHTHTPHTQRTIKKGFGT